MGNASENKTPVIEIINFLKFNKTYLTWRPCLCSIRAETM